MKTELIESKGNFLSMKVEGIGTPLMNAIRRYCIGHVDVMAVDSVTMYENTSSMFDEYISHRIGLLPLVSPKGLKEGMEVSFSLDESGPKIVYSGDLKTTDKDVKVAKDRIPIITLFENQNLRLECKAVTGTGQSHAKFQSGIAAYGEEKEGTFVFKVESFHQMKPKELVARACKKLEKDVLDLAKALKKAK
ncbi:MAG: DNA-directed RNA polymerase subunit D [Candidatus Micrarchaeia archaeon]